MLFFGGRSAFSRFGWELGFRFVSPSFPLLVVEAIFTTERKLMMDDVNRDGQRSSPRY